MSGLRLTNIHKSFGDVQALRGVSFNVTRGEIVALLGPSGCGKSTLLAIIAGLEAPERGTITWNEQALQGIPTHKRGFGLMFQDYMLFPHKNVGDNVAFGLKMAKWKAEKITARVNETLNLVGLSGYALRDVGTLSGGEQQRVALARSLAPNPRLLMLDEPLGSLDRGLRERLLVELGDILRAMRQTALYVTHDQEEAFMLADRIVVMHRGQVAQIGTPQEIYQQPASVFVARFLGFKNLLKAEYRQGMLVTEIGDFALPTPMEVEKPVTVLIRPDALHLDGRGSHAINGTVHAKAFRGSLCRVEVEIRGTVLNFEFPSAAALPETGATLELRFNPDEVIQVLT